MAEFYIDESGLIYAAQASFSASEDTVSTVYSVLGLNDISSSTDSSMSTWLIDNVRWKVQISMNSDTPLSTEAYGTVCMGVAPTDLGLGIADDLQTPSDYQDYKGWPLKRGFDSWMVSDHASAARTSVSGTWKPKNNTALNRLQQFVLAVNVDFGQNALSTFAIRRMIIVQAKRGR